METIPKADCENIGFIRKTHGVHGDVVLEYETQFEYSIEKVSRFFVELDGLLVPFFLEEGGFRFRSANSAVLNFDGVNTSDYAKRLVNRSVYLFESEITIIEEEPSVSDFENFLLIDEGRGEIGTIDHVDDFSGNVVFTVQYKNEEKLIPFNEELLVSLNPEKQIITLKLPEGLLE